MLNGKSQVLCDTVFLFLSFNRRTAVLKSNENSNNTGRQEHLIDVTVCSWEIQVEQRTSRVGDLWHAIYIIYRVCKELSFRMTSDPYSSQRSLSASSVTKNVAPWERIQRLSKSKTSLFEIFFSRVEELYLHPTDCLHSTRTKTSGICHDSSFGIVT